MIHVDVELGYGRARETALAYSRHLYCDASVGHQRAASATFRRHARAIFDALAVAVRLGVAC